MKKRDETDEIALVYFRAGYAPVDYTTQDVINFIHNITEMFIYFNY